MKRTSIGGQGVLEGVMMRSPETTAIAVRRESGEIVTQKQRSQSLSARYKILNVPIIRGVVNFVEMMISGVKTITDAAKMYDPEDDEMEPSKADEFIAEKTGKNPMDVAIFFAVVIALVIAVGLFFILPNLITGWITPYIDSSLGKNLVDGLIRVGMFLIYLVAISNMKDIKRLFGYHGAEHKVINCFEHDMPMDVEHARENTRLHPRCGTSFLLIVMIISILLFTLLGWSENWAIRIGLRLLMLPVVAGVSYEILKLVAKYDNKFTMALRKPGMALQYLTTREPDDGMIEVALVSFLAAEDKKTDEEIDELARKYSHKIDGSPADFKDMAAQPSGQETLANQ
ncbi:membrane protein [Christensenellaceae bacterium]|nr:membrane protein [Christensenellaceae bacterium]BDF62273.1 membrane protein [Christensenellaceae bacterium]